MNNPLKYADYSGYTWLDNFGNWVVKNWKPIVTITATVLVTAGVTVLTAGLGTPWVAAMIVGGSAGFTSGALSTWLNGGSFWQGMGSGAINAVVGGLSGIAGGAAAGWASKNLTSFALKSLEVSYKSAIGGFVSGAIGGMAGGAASGFVAGLATGDLDKALEMAGQGAILGTIAGGTISGYRGYKAAQASGSNPWTGQARSNDLSKAFNLDNTLKRISKGESYSHRNDGSVFKNNEGYLPENPKGYYKEFVHPTQGVQGPGAQRIIIGTKGEIYYSPDHYKTFIKIY